MDITFLQWIYLRYDGYILFTMDICCLRMDKTDLQWINVSGMKNNIRIISVNYSNYPKPFFKNHPNKKREGIPLSSEQILYVKAEVDNVSVFYDVFFAF